MAEYNSADQSPFIVGKSALFLCLWSRGLSKNIKKREKKRKIKAPIYVLFIIFCYLLFSDFAFSPKGGLSFNFGKIELKGRQKDIAEKNQKIIKRRASLYK